MPTIRREKRENPFTQISRDTLQDKRLSWQARGMLAYLLSKPDGWQTNVWALVDESPSAKRDAVRGILTELKALGYIELIKVRNDLGQQDGVEYVIREGPEQASIVTSPQTAYPAPADPAPACPAPAKAGAYIEESNRYKRTKEKKEEKSVPAQPEPSAEKVAPTGIIEAGNTPQQIAFSIVEKWCYGGVGPKTHAGRIGKLASALLVDFKGIENLVAASSALSKGKLSERTDIGLSWLTTALWEARKPTSGTAGGDKPATGLTGAERNDLNRLRKGWNELMFIASPETSFASLVNCPTGRNLFPMMSVNPHIWPEVIAFFEGRGDDAGTWATLSQST